MTSLEFAARLEHIASRVRTIRPADHRRPEIFFEDQSEVVAEILAEARELRVSVAMTPVKRPTIRPGVISIGRRDVRVEVRRRRA